jgi:hypothetical protein
VLSHVVDIASHTGRLGSPCYKLRLQNKDTAVSAHIPCTAVCRTRTLQYLHTYLALPFAEQGYCSICTPYLALPFEEQGHCSICTHTLHCRLWPLFSALNRKVLSNIYNTQTNKMKNPIPRYFILQYHFKFSYMFRSSRDHRQGIKSEQHRCCAVLL